MADTHENGKPAAAAAAAVDAGTTTTTPKAGKDDTARLKKRIQRHYDVTSDQFLKVWY